MKRLVPLAAVLGLLAVAVLFWPTLYIYGNDNSGNFFRVNRFSGFKEHATDSGWMSADEEMKYEEHRLAMLQKQDAQELLRAIDRGQVAQVQVGAPFLDVMYTDGTSRQILFAPNTMQPMLAAFRQRKVDVISEPGSALNPK